MEGIKRNTNSSFSPYPLLVIGLILLAYVLLKQAWLMAAVVVIMPFLAFYVVVVLNKPYWGFITLFVLKTSKYNMFTEKHINKMISSISINNISLSL